MSDYPDLYIDISVKDKAKSYVNMIQFHKNNCFTQRYIHESKIKELAEKLQIAREAIEFTLRNCDDISIERYLALQMERIR